VVTPAEAFAVGGVAIPSAVRLSLSAPDTLEEVETALIRLAHILTVQFEPLRVSV
jgi:hypothetical protein